jgi:hypothetical protein
MNETTAFTLACRDGHSQPPVLRDVFAAARLDGTLFELTLRQTYRNTGTQLLEVVYTFPLLPRGVLLAFATELNGTRMQGTMLPRRQAEQVYVVPTPSESRQAASDSDSQRLHSHVEPDASARWTTVMRASGSVSDGFSAAIAGSRQLAMRPR